MRIVTMQVLGQRIQAARERLGLSQAELSRRLQLSDQSNLSRWERAQAEPGIIAGAKAAASLGLSPNDALLMVPSEAPLSEHQPVLLSSEEAELLRILRLLDTMMQGASRSPIQVTLNWVRETHKMVMPMLAKHTTKSKKKDTRVPKKKVT